MMRGPSIGATVERSALATVTSPPVLSGTVAANVRTWARQVGRREGIHLAFACPGVTSLGAGVQRGPS
eukprot:201951-Lingulodinium_polyedra.AAC.1